MKKHIALLLALVMIASLFLVGSAFAADEETDWSAIAAEIEPLNITYNSTSNENETNGLMLKQFESYLSDLSDGKITMTIYWGGTVYNDATVFEACRDGAIDMFSVNPMQDGEYLHFLNFGQYGIGPKEKVIDLWNEMLFENEETAAIFQEEAESFNLHYLNVIYNGADALCATYEWSTFDDLLEKCGCIGSGDNAKFDAMGLSSVYVVPPETYDALQRGICDTSNCALFAVYSMSWDEVAPYVVLNGLRAAGSCYTVNLNFWNGLSEGQQAIIEEAAHRLSDYSIEYLDSMEQEMIDTISERSGVEVQSFSDEDALRYFSYWFDSNAANCMNRVAGNEEDAANLEMILTRTAQFYGYDWTYEG